MGRLVEYFGFRPGDPAGLAVAKKNECVFIGSSCTKPGLGGCTLELTNNIPVIICPNRLYANSFEMLRNIAQQAFGKYDGFIDREEAIKIHGMNGSLDGKIVIFGEHWGGELTIPAPTHIEKTKSDNFKIDYILAQFKNNGEIKRFTAVEIQSIDISNSYKEESESLIKGEQYTDKMGRTPGWTKSSLNWANVSKRIIPQLIYKGNVLRQEKLCDKGLFFVCPTPVLERIKARLGSKLPPYPIGSGTLTFQAYDVAEHTKDGVPRALRKGETLTTTVDQIAYAFVSIANLPDPGVYKKAIDRALRRDSKK